MRLLRIAIVVAAPVLVLGACGGTKSPPLTPKASARLTFGIYPGGGGRAATALENSPTTISALLQLRAPGRQLVLRTYSGYTGALPWRYYRDILSAEVAYDERLGFDTELVLRFAPLKDRGSPRDVRSFVSLVRRIVGLLGSDPRFVSLQITNEADRGDTAASDGYFNREDSAWKALIEGVIAAKATATTHRFAQLKVGFNYGAANPAFWRYLGAHGGAQFRRALDWVGIDTYPGTLTPLATSDLRTGIAQAIAQSLSTTRHSYLPLARIPATTAVHFSEVGFATHGGRTYAMQATALRSAVDTALARSRADHITEYLWFDLRDANSESSSIDAHFGLLQTNYEPKPAFNVYARLIQLFGL